jgi:hypothetical protein
LSIYISKIKKYLNNENCEKKMYCSFLHFSVFFIKNVLGYQAVAIWDPKFKNLVAQVLLVRTVKRSEHARGVWGHAPHENFEFFKGKSFILIMSIHIFEEGRTS